LKTIRNCDCIKHSQKIGEEVFKSKKLIKDNGVDKEAALKYIDEKVKEAVWKPIFKTGVEECHKEITEKSAELVKEMAGEPFNIKKDQCNVTYMAMMTCVHLEAFTVSDLFHVAYDSHFANLRTARRKLGPRRRNARNSKTGWPNAKTKSQLSRTCSAKRTDDKFSFLVACFSLLFSIK